MRPIPFIAALTVLSAACLTSLGAHAQGSAPIKVGLMLPATGTFAALGDMIEKGFTTMQKVRAAMKLA